MDSLRTLPLLFLLIIPAQLIAQNEIERERISLQGLQEFGFTANIEGSRTIAGDPNLTPGILRQDAVNQLREANLRFVSDDQVSSSADIPFLYMHVNAMELENGLVPFSIQLRLYQPVKLILNRDLQTSASTWENSVVGIVTLDRLPMINEAASALVADFLDDYATYNRR
jgi:hypothetical protein